MIFLITTDNNSLDDNQSESLFLLKPSGLNKKDIRIFAENIRNFLQKHLQSKTDIPILSIQTKKHIKRQVPPKTLDFYLNCENAINLLALEIEDLGGRIFNYQYIERYQTFLMAPDKEMRQAFINHTHALRGNEIYTILERATVLLDFISNLASDIGLNSTNTSRKLKPLFDQTFKRHLRERHRMVHAHERPSLISRMLSLPTENTKDSDIVNLISNVMKKLFSAVSDNLGEIEGKNINSMGPDEWKKIQLNGLDREAMEMWNIFSNLLNTSVSINNVNTGKKE